MATGVATGLLGDLMMYVLFSVEHLTYDHSHASFEFAVGQAGAVHRVVALAIAGAVGGVAWYVWRRVTAKERS
ncbi:MAG: chloride channel protein, partial [Acidimicrobiales bacterium]